MIDNVQFDNFYIISLLLGILFMFIVFIVGIILLFVSQFKKKIIVSLFLICIFSVVVNLPLNKSYDFLNQLYEKTPQYLETVDFLLTFYALMMSAPLITTLIINIKERKVRVIWLILYLFSSCYMASVFTVYGVSFPALGVFNVVIVYFMIILFVVLWFIPIIFYYKSFKS